MATNNPQFPTLLDFGKLDKVKPPFGFRPNSQPQYDYITAEEPNLWFWGNRGGGKSVTARWTCHARALSYPGYRYAILRTSFPELIKNHLIYLGAEMEAIWGKKDKGWNASKFIATYPNGSMGFYMQVETDDQARNALGVEMMEVVFDEAPTFKWDHIMMIRSSVRVPVDSGLTPLTRLNGNPIGTCVDDIWKYFIDKDVPDDEAFDPDTGQRIYFPDEWRSLRIDMRDNADLDVVAYRKQLGVGLTPALRKAWLAGERFDEGALFELKPKIDAQLLTHHGGTDEENKREQPLAPSMLGKPYHIITELPVGLDSAGNKTSILELPWVRIQGGYDDGYVDPAVMLWGAQVGQQLVMFNERVWTRTHSPKIAQGILESSVIVRPDAPEFQLPLSTIYADPTIGKETTAVQSTLQVMQSQWLCLVHGAGEKRCCEKSRTLTFEPSTNSRELYATAIHRFLNAEIAPGVPRVVFLKVDPATDKGRELVRAGIVGCPYLIKYLPKMLPDENDPKKMASHKHDHPVCAFAYLCMSYPVNTRPPSEAAIRPSWWNEYFIGNSNVPRPQPSPRKRWR